MDGADIATATTVALSADEQAMFDQQWAAAVAAVDDLDTPAELAAAGYVQAAVQGAGVGVHYVDWTLVDRPFDPARPAMVLVDERDGRHDLVGFSYWIHATGAGRVRRAQRHVAPAHQPVHRQRLGRSGDGRRPPRTAPATSSGAPTCGCCTPGWCPGTRIAGGRSPRSCRRCARPRPGPRTSAAARRADRSAAGAAILDACSSVTTCWRGSCSPSAARCSWATFAAIARPPAEPRDEGALDRAPLARSIVMGGVGLVAAIWALASLLGG